MPPAASMTPTARYLPGGWYVTLPCSLSLCTVYCMLCGVLQYPGYEFFKRALLSAVGPAGALLYHAPLVILAGALATIIACLGVCPAEAIRIRMVARQEPFTDTLTRVAEEEGLSALYDGFPPLLVRQVLFGMAKFLIFDAFGSAVLASFPQLNDHVASQLGVSLLSGLVAGVVSAIVSQPADTVLSKMNAAPPDAPEAAVLVSSRSPITLPLPCSSLTHTLYTHTGAAKAHPANGS